MSVDQMIDELIGREGGYVDHPADRGGPTNFGITEQVARAYGYRGPMQSLPRGTAAAIYRERYWTGPSFDQVYLFYPRIAVELFDAGVNMGQARAAGFLQRALNLLNRSATDYPDIATDGQIGKLSLFALGRYKARRPGSEGEAVLLWAIRAFRTGRYAEIAERDQTQEAFTYGWIARQVRAA